MLRSFFRPAAMSCLFFMLVMPEVEGKELEDRKWIEVSTEHFRVRSTLSEKKTIKLVRNLDLLRLAIPAVTRGKRTESSVPTHIFVFNRTADFDIFGIDRGVAGVFKHGLRNNTIFIRNTPGADEAHTIQHEYVHFLMRNHTGFALPRWFDEGYAEYLSATKIQRNLFHIGRPLEDRMYELQNSGWLDASTMLDSAAYEQLGPRKSLFYAQSWLMVHFFLNRGDRETDFREDMRAYMEQVASGIDETEAFENAFGISDQDFLKELRRYFESSCCNVIRFRIDSLQTDFSPEVKQMTRAEISLRLAQTALEWGKINAAQQWFDIAAEAEETRPWAESGLGSISMLDEDYETAQTHFETAVSLAPGDAQIQLDLASYWLAQAEASDFPGDQEAFLAQARNSFVQSWKLDDTKPETYVLYGRTFLLEGSRQEKAIEMFEAAQYLHPSNIQIRLMLADAYARADRKDDAVAMAQLVLSWGHDDVGIVKYANEIIASTNEGEPAEVHRMEDTEP